MLRYTRLDMIDLICFFKYWTLLRQVINSHEPSEIRIHGRSRALDLNDLNDLQTELSVGPGFEPAGPMWTAQFLIDITRAVCPNFNPIFASFTIQNG